MMAQSGRLLVLPFLAAALWILSQSGTTLSPEAAAGGALTLGAVGFWATGLIPEHVTSLLFFLVAMVFAVAEPSFVFSGFAAGAFWLLFGGMILGSAVGRTGLGARLARRLALALGHSYTGLLIGIGLVSLVMSFLMPSSTGRVVLLMPVAAALAEGFRFQPNSPGRAGILITTGLTAVIPGFAILPANVPNLVMAGAADTIYGVTITYAEFFVLHFPVLGLLKCALIVAVGRLMFPDQLPDNQIDREPATALSRDEKALALILAGALILWATDFLHGVSPAWVALFAGICCLLPPFRLVPADKIDQVIQLKPLLFIAGVLSVGPVAVATGFGNQLADAFLSIAPLSEGADNTNFLTLVGAAIVTSVVATAPTVPAVWTPLAESIAQATGIPLKQVIMLQVPAFSTMLFPYQVPPIVVALHFGGVNMRQGTIAVFVVALLTIALLLPLDLVWWHLIGGFNG